MMKVWAHVAPHLANQTPSEALVAMHIARCDAATFPKKAKQYSEAYLADLGITKVEGKWVKGPPPVTVYAESVGIAVKSKFEEVRKRIHAAMSDALENERAKGTTDPLKQRSAMLKARDHQRFKLGMA